MNTSKKILVVDDDKDLTDILQDKLSKAGFSVMVEHDGDAGFQTAIDKKPDLILLDIKMPKADGLSMAEKLRADEWGKKAEVIFLTVMDQPEVLSKAMELGSYEYFVKTDWKIDEIIERIKKKLNI